MKKLLKAVEDDYKMKIAEESWTAYCDYDVLLLLMLLRVNRVLV